MITDREITKLAEGCEAIELPEVVESKINNTYEMIRNKKTSRSLSKNIVAAAISVILLASIGLIYTNPTLAKAVSQIKYLFRDDRLNKYSSEINATAKDKGLELTVKEVVYDRDTISLIYTLKSDKPLQVKETDLVSMLPPNYGGRDIKCKGASVTGWAYAGNEKIDDNTYLIKEQLYCKGILFPPSKKIKLDMDIHKLAGVEGSWKLSFNANTDNFGDNARDVRVNKKVSFGDYNLKLSKVLITPINSKIMFNNFKLPLLSSNSIDDYNMERNILSIADDKGSGVVSSIGAFTSDSLGTRGEFNFELNDEKLPEYITITPLKRITKKPIDYNRELRDDDNKEEIPKVIYGRYKTYGTLDKLPVTIEGGKFGKASIYQIAEKDDRIDFYIQVDSKYVSVFNEEIAIYDKTKEKSSLSAYPVNGNIFHPLGGNKYFISMYQKENFDLSRLKDYEVCATDIEKNYEIAGDELKINIR